jgi:antitoxin component YwqK of YwqJK toxin-antitoxin module
MSSFPKTAWVLIFKYADFRTFVNLSLVCKMSKRILYGDIQTTERLDEYKESFRLVNLSWDALKNIPKNKHFRELYLEAVKRNGDALQYVPNEKRTEEICLEAVKQNGNVLYYIPEGKRTEEICLEAVKQNGHALMYVSMKIRHLVHH